MEIKQSGQGLMRMVRTMLATGLAYAVNLGIMLLITPHIMRTVGAESYGFVSLAKQFADYAVIVTMALNTYAARYIAVSYHRQDREEANAYFSSVFWGDFVLATVILALAVLGIVFLQYIISIPEYMLKDVKLLFLFVFLEFWVVTVFSAFGCAGYIKDKMDLTGLFKALAVITNAAVLVAAYVLFPSKAFYIGIGLLVEAAVVALTDIFMTRRFTPELKLSRKAFSLPLVKKLVLEGCWASLNSVGDLLNSGLDLLICNQMLSSLAMGQLAVAKTINTIVQSLYVIVDKAFFPSFLKLFASGDNKALLERLKLSMKASGLLANLMFAGFAALGLCFYRLWIPQQDTKLIYYLTLITISSCVSSGAIHPLYYIYTLTVKKKIPCIITIAGGIANVAAMYILIKYCGMGVYSVAVTTMVVMALIGFVTNPLYMAHVLKLPYKTFYPDIARSVLSCMILLALFMGLERLFSPASWAGLVLCGLCCCAAGTPVHMLIVCSKKERTACLNFLRALLKSDSRGQA